MGPKMQKLSQDGTRKGPKQAKSGLKTYIYVVCTVLNMLSILYLSDPDILQMH